MKKWIILLSALAVAVGLTACGAKTPTESTTETTTESTTESTTETTTLPETTGETRITVMNVVTLYGCPNSKRTARLQMKKRMYR